MTIRHPPRDFDFSLVPSDSGSTHGRSSRHPFLQGLSKYRGAPATVIVILALRAT